MAQYRTGTVSLVNGSPIVTGTGTNWTALDLSGPAKLFMVSPAGSLYYVDSVINDNELHLTAPWAGATINDVAYAIHTDFFPNGIPMLNENDVEVVAVYNEAMRILSGNGGTLKVGRNLSDLANKQVAFNEIRQTATVNSAGVVELAMDSEAQSQAGSKVLTAANLNALEATTNRKGLVEKATANEITNGTANKYPDSAGLKAALATYRKAGLKTISLAGTGIISPTVDDIDANILVLDGPAGADRIIQWPNNKAGQWLIINNDNSGNALTIKTLSGSGVSFSQQGEQRFIMSDGTDMKNVILSNAKGTAGKIESFAMSSPPEGYLKANGAVVSRTAYANLFEAIGTAFGAGDGATTFQLPDLRGEFIRGWDDGRGVDSGRDFGSWQEDEFESHRHDVRANSSGSSNLGNASGNYLSGGSTDKFRSSHNTNMGSSMITLSGGNETRPRNKAMLMCISY